MGCVDLLLILVMCIGKLHTWGFKLTTLLPHSIIVGEVLFELRAYWWA